MGQYEKMMQELRSAFDSGKTKSEEWRLNQLYALVNMIKENEDKIYEVMYKDLHKCKFETGVMEINICLADLADAINNLSNWMKPQKVGKGPIYMMDSAYMHPEPFGISLIIGAWNYPFQLTILPLIGAIAAGNCAVIKPSELAEHTAQFLEDHIPKYLDTDCFKIVNGAVPETSALLEEKFDIIFYTGNAMVGKIVMAAAAKHLTPVVLELGGKSPVYIDEGLDIKVVAKRIAWGKFVNSGQTCVAPDYILCPSKIQDALIKSLQETITDFYTEDPQKSDSYSRIINERHFHRIEKLKEGCSVAVGGESDVKDKYIAPTVIKDVKPSDPIMTEEIFGPVLPIMPVADHNEAIRIINDREKPLSLYVFSNKKKIMEDFRVKTSSGALLVNDTVVHGGLNTLPFGGVGNSGMGAYHGKHTFDCFSHKKAVLEKSLAMEKVNDLRYPPFTDSKMSWLNWFLAKKVKRKGPLSFLPFMVLGTVFAMVFKTMGVTAEAVEAIQE